MNPDLWYSTATSELLTSFRTAVGGGVVAILVLILLAWRGRRTGFPLLATLLLLLSQGARAALLAGAFAAWIPPSGHAVVSAVCLGLGAAALLGMVGCALRQRRAGTFWVAILWLAAWLMVALSFGIAMKGDVLAGWTGWDATRFIPDLALLAAALSAVSILALMVLAFMPPPRSSLSTGLGTDSGRRTRRANGHYPVGATLDSASGQRQIEARLTMLNEVLEQQRHTNALLAHEMRSPMATISAAVQSLEMVLEGSDEQIESRLQRISRSVARISELMDQLLAQESTYDEAVAPRHEIVDLARLSADVIASVQNEVAHRLRLEAPEPAPAWCDGPLTGVVLRNLIHNAAKYSPADQPIAIQVGTLTTPDERTAWIAVADRGPGIEQEDQTRIFEPHFRRAAHRETKGMGLGLYLVRKICERQGGTLTVESKPGHGARFTIALPTNRVR